MDGKPQYNPPTLPKAPAKIAVSLWLTDGRKPNPNGVQFSRSSQLAKADYVQTVLPDGCEDGMGTGATYFSIQPLDFETLRQQ